MSTDNFNNNPGNTPQNDEELTAILKRLSQILDQSVSLDDAITLAKEQKAKEAGPQQKSAPKTEQPSPQKKKNAKDNGQLSFDLTEEAAEEENENLSTIELITLQKQIYESAEPSEELSTTEETPEKTDEESEPETEPEYTVEQEEMIPVIHEDPETEQSAVEEAPPAADTDDNDDISMPADITEEEPNASEEAVAEEAEENAEEAVTEESKENISDNTETEENSIDPQTAALLQRLKAAMETDQPIDQPKEEPKEESTEEATATEECETAEETVTQSEAAEQETEVSEETATEETQEEPIVITEDIAEQDNTVTSEETEETVAEQQLEKAPKEEVKTETEENDEISDTADPEPETELATAKIFDELLACFDGHKLPDDFRFSDYNTTENETDLQHPEDSENEHSSDTAEESVTEPVSADEETDNETLKENEAVEENEATAETEDDDLSAFTPIDHDIEKEDDELFSKIFSEEKSERKNRENDKKKWQKQSSSGSAFLAGLFDWVEVIVMSAAFALLLFTFVLRLAVVDGDSMNYTLLDKELLIISDLMYTPDNGDIIVFNSDGHPEPLVKRVIATEGQTVDIDFETWTVTVDGVPLKEDYINKTAGVMNSKDVTFPLTVDEGYVFVMGDNRNNSKDSRDSTIGLVDVRNILGEVKLRLFPFDRFGKVD